MVWPAARWVGTALASSASRRLFVPLGGGGTLSGPRRRAPRPYQSAASSAWTPSWVTIDATLVVLAEFPSTNRREGLLPLYVRSGAGLKQSSLQAGRVDVDMLLLCFVVTYYANGQRFADSKIMTQFAS